ncbi:MAG: hypothetical protein J7L38_08440 [Thermoproteales archaeon]|nr:hypothetical protein [Thermoproteales archaeon]
MKQWLCRQPDGRASVTEGAHPPKMLFETPLFNPIDAIHPPPKQGAF